MYQLAEKEGIAVCRASLPLCRSMSVQENGRCYIGLDDMPESQERVHLAHELGHCLTGSFYNRYTAHDLRGRHEYRANKWAIHRLLPRCELEDALAAGYRETWELAEHFNVTEELIKEAITLYQQIENPPGAATLDG